MPLPEEQNDPVWELLKRARRDDVGPFFSRNVVREIRRLESERGSSVSAWLSWLRRPLVVSGMVAALAVVSLVTAVVVTKPSSDLVAPAPALVEPAIPALADADFDPASEVGSLEYLGQLMAVSDPAALDDAALADLLF